MVKNRLPSIDALRFVSALFVFGYHVFFIGPILGFWTRDIFKKFFYYGEFGVDVFFVISGFVITISSEGKTGFDFARSRILRLVPTFLICSAITMLFDVTIPGVDPLERLVSWLFSLTFFPKAFGHEYLSSVYWTLSIEITFYFWVFLFIATGVWSTKRKMILSLFSIIAILNVFLGHGPLKDFFEIFFIARYAGHFVFGIILYELYTKRTMDGFASVILLMAGFLVGFSVYRHNLWIEGISKGGVFSIQDKGVMLVPVVIFMVVYFVAESSRFVRSDALSRFMVFIGSLSYPFYLLHADLSFYAHAMFERNIFGMGIYAGLVGTSGMIWLAIISALLLSCLVCLYIEPMVRPIFLRIFDGVGGRYMNNGARA